MTESSASGSSTSGTTRRIIMDRGEAARSHLEIERSHIEGKAARLTAGVSGSGIILHMTEAELARLVQAGLRLLPLDSPGAASCSCKPHPVFGHEDGCRYEGMGRAS
jgi:hypothetical protein